MSNTIASTTLPSLGPAQWLTERAQHASRELNDCVELNPEKLGGVPVLKGTRIAVAQVLAEMGEGQSAEQVAEDLDLDVSLVKRLVLGLAICLDRPVAR
jgi:uncharacterized protein (DUF433 family)